MSYIFMKFGVTGLWLLSYAFSNKNSIPALFTYSTSALSSLFYSEPSTGKVQHSSTIETIVGEVPPMADQKNYGWKDEIIPSPVKSNEEIDSQKLKELDSIISLLVERVKLIENANVHQNDALADVKQEQNVIIGSTADLKKHYDEKLAAMEKKIEDSEKLVLTSNANEIRELESTIKTCCDKTSAIPVVEVEKHLNNILGGYFSSENMDGTKTVSKEDLARTIKNLFIAKSDLEARIADINSTLQVNVRDVRNLADKVMADITSQINLHMLASDDGGGGGGGDGGDGSGGLTEKDVRRIVTNALKIYDADKTGRVDYALESAGGQVISTRCTQKYNLDTRAYTIYGYVLFYQNTNPQTVIQGDPIQPGKCWVFQDFPGYLLIKLRTLIHITGFTIEHAPRSILPNGDMRSAPRKFNVWGYNDENDKEPVLLGEYEFEDSHESLQYFPVQNSTNKPYEIVELRIHSNHGQMHYTSLYRFRVHGVPA